MISLPALVRMKLAGRAFRGQEVVSRVWLAGRGAKLELGLGARHPRLHAFFLLPSQCSRVPKD